MKSKIHYIICFSFLLIFIFSSFRYSRAEKPDYPEIFNTGWQKALKSVSENKELMIQLCASYNVDYKMAVTVVFPELVRYSIIRDKIEITLLKALYTNKGSEYSNFSVGIFQIKPSCAEAVLTRIPLINDTKLELYFRKLHRGLKDYALRAAIVRELEDPHLQFMYVVGIIKILDNKFLKLHWGNDEEKFRFYAAAYNSGFSNSEYWIRQQMEAKTFHTSILKPSICYSYADVAGSFYKENFSANERGSN